MNNKTSLIEWGSKSLSSEGYLLEHSPEIIIETPWSTVIRFSTSQGNFYLKQTPADLFIETDIIRAIQKNIPHSPTPLIISENHELNCFLMRSCGDHSLRTKFNGTIEPDLLFKGLRSYINLMRSFENNHSALEEIEIPDWRLNRLPDLYVDMLAKKALLLEEGLSIDELDKLMQLVPTIKSICEFLSEQKIKETLVNGDFNENNLIINETTQKISIIDWGECIITHPFFSIAAHTQSLARRYKLGLEGQLLQEIKQEFLSCWLDVVKMNELDTIYEQILRLQPIFSTLAIYRLQSATANKSKEKQTWFIGPILKSMIN